MSITSAGFKEENGSLTCWKETEELGALVSSGAEQQRGVTADLSAAFTERRRAETSRRLLAERAPIWTCRILTKTSFCVVVEHHKPFLLSYSKGLPARMWLTSPTRTVWAASWGEATAGHRCCPHSLLLETARLRRSSSGPSLCHLYFSSGCTHSASSAVCWPQPCAGNGAVLSARTDHSPLTFASGVVAGHAECVQ